MKNIKLNIDELKEDVLYSSDYNDALFSKKGNKVYEYIDVLNDWVLSTISYNRISDVSFWEATHKVKWDRVPKFTEVGYISDIKGSIRTGYFIGIHPDFSDNKRILDHKTEELERCYRCFILNDNYKDEYMIELTNSEKNQILGQLSNQMGVKM